ncbi:MAG: hypothetical protein ABEK16_03120 [Candidatus Nanohalobium sp.]
MTDRRNLGSSERNSLPGNEFASAYATVYHEVGDKLVYSTFDGESSLEDFLNENAVEAVRLNEAEQPEFLEGYETEVAVSRYTGDFRAVLYEDSGDLIRSSEKVVEDHELFENPEEALEQEVN